MAGAERPFAAYRGADDFVFVSYAHADAPTVFADIRHLHDAGVNVYYDEGISPGSRWTSELAEAIEKCSLFVAFLSPSSVASENCTNEVEFAQSRGKPLLTVYLDETDLPAGLELSLGGRQALMRHALSADAYRAKLLEAVERLLAGEPVVLGGRPRRRWLPWFATALAGLLLVLGVWFVTEDSGPAPSPEADLRLAIAVRPFDTTGVESGEHFFANGVADDLVLRLGRWRTLPVVARSASFAEGVPDEPRAAGRALNARYVLEGTVRGSPDGFRLVVFLVDAASGESVWSEEYQVAPGEALEVQAEIADAIVGRINPALLSAEAARAVRADPANLDAWSAAMRGWWHLNLETEAGLVTAQDWFRKAMALDPTWSWPHSALALSAYRAYINGWAADPRRNNELLIEAAETAVSLDARDAFAHHALGHAYAAQGRIQESLDALARGVELAPNDSMANSCYAMQLAASARPQEAQTVIEHAMALSPGDPWEHRFALVKARAHFAAAEYPAAEDWALRSQQLKPSMGAFLHSVAAPALGDGLTRAQERLAARKAQGPLPPLAGIERGFGQTTARDYLERFLEGLKRAGF